MEVLPTYIRKKLPILLLRDKNKMMNFASLQDWPWCEQNFPIIAGPCSAESREQVLEVAQQISPLGLRTIFRAGVWKPRTRPNNFEGHGMPALGWMQEARKLTGLPLAVEVANSGHVEMCLKYNIDVLWIGARTTVNPFFVQEIAP